MYFTLDVFHVMAACTFRPFILEIVGCGLEVKAAPPYRTRAHLSTAVILSKWRVDGWYAQCEEVFSTVGY